MKPNEASFCAGYFKIVEEMGECLAVLGKLGPFPKEDHPDGVGPVRPRLLLEIADVEAALRYFKMKNLTAEEREYLEGRVVFKLKRFNQWGLTGLVVQESEERYDRPGPELA